jgi:hypothetical protein
MISAGLHLTDLNLFDSTSDLLITGIHQERESAASISKVSFPMTHFYFVQVFDI